ncbi:MAG: serine/threonine-protein kinase, partial [Pirellulales bacterium]
MHARGEGTCNNEEMACQHPHSFDGMDHASKMPSSWAWPGAQDRVASAGPSDLSDVADDFDLAVGCPLELRSGTKLAGMTITAFIACGGMGRVYEATQDALGRRVAIKVMHDGVVSSAQLKRFEYEAHILAQLRHPHIAQIYALTATQVHGLRVPFFVMELVADAKAITHFCQHARMSLRDRVSIMRKVTAAVAYGHQKGVIHRDLKPANILVASDGEPKVIDFGIARASFVLNSPQTHPGQVIGTVQYMSPEQLVGSRDVDARSDVYALGLVLFELITGQLPYDIRRLSVLEALAAIERHDTRVGLRVFGSARQEAGLSNDDARSLGAIVSHCLAHQPDCRYHTAADLLGDLTRWLAHEPVGARPYATYEILLRLARKHRAAVALIAGVLISMVAAIIGVFLFAVRAEQSAATAREHLYRSTVLLANGSRQRGAVREAKRLLLSAQNLLPGDGEAVPIELRLLDASLEESVRTLHAHKGTVRGVSWHPSGQQVISAGEDGMLKLWSPFGVSQPAQHMKPVCQILAHREEPFWTTAWSPTGDHIAAAGATGFVGVWPVTGTHGVVSLKGHQGIVYGIDFSPDGKHLVTGGRDGTARIWDVLSGNELTRCEPHGGTIYSVVFSPDGRQVVMGLQNSTASVWNIHDSHPHVVLSGHTGRVFDVLFFDQGRKIATASEDATVRVWDADTGN